MKIKLLLLCCLCGFIANGQQVNQCGIIIPPKSLRSTFSSVYEARDVVNNMLENINWKENFTIQEQNGINNAYATIIRNQRYIIYDNVFLESLDNYAGTQWASISVLAHEMGHHYRNHVIDRSGSTPPKEIEADYFSGYVMAKLGASLQEARGAMETIASPRASGTHPAKADRLNAIAEGWNSAKGVSGNNTGSNNGNNGNNNGNSRNIPPTLPPQQQQTPPSASDASWIYLSLYGNDEITVYLSDDGRKFTPAPLTPAQPFVFKFEVYSYGWMRLSNTANAPVYKLLHGKDYAVIWNRRANRWTVVPVQ
jgi:hypothetical protein